MNHTNPSDALTVGAAARAVGVTVRTLHYWDRIGVVSTSRRTAGGYRLYGPADLARIRRVLVYRDAGMGLDDIKTLLDETDAVDGSLGTLQRQRDELRKRSHDLSERAEALDRIISARVDGLALTPDQQVATFGDRWQPSWNQQARQKWGRTSQWAQYAELAAHRTIEDWQRIADAAVKLESALTQAFRAGTSPGSPMANALAENHRASLAEYFDCTVEMHVCLGRTYVTDDGFRDHYDGLEFGLAEWLRSIIDANARANGIDPNTATWPGA